jgi:SAM-dependent methyltransferase
VVARTLFELPYSPEWGYEERFFLDVEHRYTKMHRLLREGYGDLAGARIVDLGLSRGLLLERFRRYRDVQLLGIEIDPAEIDHARERGLEPTRHFINVFDGHRMTARLPYDDASVDVVLAGEIIEHIVDSESFLREILRVLRPGGATVLSTPNVLWWKHRLHLLIGCYPDALDYRTRYGDDFGHVRAFTPDLLRDLLLEVGFSNVRVVGKRLGPISLVARPPNAVARVLDRAAERLPRLADHTVAFAQRPPGSDTA